MFLFDFLISILQIDDFASAYRQLFLHILHQLLLQLNVFLQLIQLVFSLIDLGVPEILSLRKLPLHHLVLLNLLLNPDSLGIPPAIHDFDYPLASSRYSGDEGVLEVCETEVVALGLFIPILMFFTIGDYLSSTASQFRVDFTKDSGSLHLANTIMGLI